MLVPIILTFLQSLDPRNFLSYSIQPTLTLKWYSTFFSNPLFVNGLEASLTIASLATIISLSVSVPTALVISRSSFRGRHGIQTLLLSPLIIPGVVLGVGLLTFFNQLNCQTAFINILIAHVVITFPYALRTVSASLVGFNRSLEESSLSLGANEMRTFWRITFPLLRPGVVAGGIFAFSISFSDVSTTVFLTNPSTVTLPVAILTYLKSYVNPVLASSSMIMIGISIIWILVIEKIFGIDRFAGTRVF